MNKLRDRLLNYYQANETKVDVLFFLGGFFFDVLTLSDIDDLLGMGQQTVYLALLGALLYFNFLDQHGLVRIPAKIQKFWEYRQAAIHFLLGSLLSLYSLFFLKSASFFTSISFVAFLVLIMVANEIKSFRDRGINLKISLFVVCLFSFFSISTAVILGFVGYFPFFISILLTIGALYLIYHFLQKKISDKKVLLKTLVAPGFGVISLCFIFYIFGLIPPVPLSVQQMGIYHNVEKIEGNYKVSHQNSNWNIFGHQGDRNFIAEPGDKIFFFAQIFSPARFNDSVVLHWYFKDPKQGWKTTDKIPMKISGGRKEGYRGYSVKQNYESGEWRVSVETTDGREIGRLYFEIEKAPEVSASRTFYQNIY